MSRAAILVLGMHRSGTSAATWLCGRMGAALPADGIDAHADNARGYHESAGLVRADDQLLRVCRSSWFDPRPLDWGRLPAGALDSRKARIREAIEAAWGGAPLLAIKDPRQCRFVPVVADVLRGMGIEARALLVLRDAAEIARSLAARDGTTPAYAHLLWLRHMIDAERATRDMPRAVIDYRALLADWRGPAARMAALCGRGVADEGEVNAFLDPALRHHSDVAAEGLWSPLDGIVAAVSAALARLAEADDADARAALDRAYAVLDAAPWLEGEVVHDELRHRRVGNPARTEFDLSPVQAEPVAAPSDEQPGAGPRQVPREPTDEGEDARLIRDSGLFDADWYRAAYPDVGDADPVLHYLRIGAPRGDRPNPLFDTAYYARQMIRRDGAQP